jgi:hypothetical protein
MQAISYITRSHSIVRAELIIDGNYASHLKTLEANEIITVEKEFAGNKINTTYMTTKKDERAFKAHLDPLEKMTRSVQFFLCPSTLQFKVLFTNLK